MPLSTIERPRLTAASAGGANSTGSLMHPAAAGTLVGHDVASEIYTLCSSYHKIIKPLNH